MFYFFSNIWHYVDEGFSITVQWILTHDTWIPSSLDTLFLLSFLPLLSSFRIFNRKTNSIARQLFSPNITTSSLPVKIISLTISLKASTWNWCGLYIALPLTISCWGAEFRWTTKFTLFLSSLKQKISRAFNLSFVAFIVCSLGESTFYDDFFDIMDRESGFNFIFPKKRRTFYINCCCRVFCVLQETIYNLQDKSSSG